MATLEAGSRAVNIVRSVNVYVDQEIGTGLGYTVYYGGQNRVGDLPERWVEADFIAGAAVAQVTSVPGGLGVWTECFLNLNCYEHQGEGIAPHNIYSLMAMADSIRQLFLVTTGITVRDYDTVGTPTVGALMVWNQPSMTEVPVPLDTGIRQINISVPMRYHEITILS